MDHPQQQEIHPNDGVEAAIAYELEQMEGVDPCSAQQQLYPPLAPSSSLSYQQHQQGHGGAGGVAEGFRQEQPVMHHQLTAFSQVMDTPSRLPPISSLHYPHQYPPHPQMQMADYAVSPEGGFQGRELMMEEGMRGVAHSPYQVGVGTEGISPGTGQIPYYPPQQHPPISQEQDASQQQHHLQQQVASSEVHQEHESVPGQLGSPQGRRNIYDVGRQLVGMVDPDTFNSRNQASRNPTHGTSSCIQQQQQQGENGVYSNYSAVTATASSPVQPPFSESGSQSAQRPPSQSVIRHTQEFIPKTETPSPASTSPVRGQVAKNIPLKTTRMPRLRPPPRKQNAQIIQRPVLPVQYKGAMGLANPCFPTPSTATVPATYQPYAQQAQHGPQFAPATWRGTYRQQLPGRSQPGNPDPIPVVDINESDDEGNATMMTAFGQLVTLPKQANKLVQKQEQPPKEWVPLGIETALPSANVLPTQNLLREHLLSPTGSQQGPSASSMFGVTSTATVVPGTLTPAATIILVKPKRKYTPRKKKEPPTQEPALGLAEGGAAVPTSEVDNGEVPPVVTPPVKPKRAYVRKKPKPPKEPPAGICDGGVVPLGSNSQIIDEPTSTSGNTIAQGHVQADEFFEEMVPGIPISNDPQGSPPPKRARGRGSGTRGGRGGGTRGGGTRGRNNASQGRGRGRGRGRPKKEHQSSQSDELSEHSTCRTDANDSLLGENVQVPYPPNLDSVNLGNNAMNNDIIDEHAKIIKQENIRGEEMEDDTNRIGDKVTPESVAIQDQDVKISATVPPTNDNDNNFIDLENRKTSLVGGANPLTTVKVEKDNDMEEEKNSRTMIDTITTEMASMTTSTRCDGTVKEEKEAVESGNENKTEVDDEVPSSTSAVKRKRPQILSSAGGDSDSGPYGERLKIMKITESTNSQSKAKSSMTSENEEGAPRRTTRSRTAALHSKQSIGSSEGLSSAKRKQKYDESSSDGEEGADDRGSSDDETIGPNNSNARANQQRKPSAPRGRGSNFQRGRGRGRGRPSAHVSVVTNRMMSTAKNIARKMTNGLQKTTYQDADEEESLEVKEHIMANVGNWQVQSAAERTFRMQSHLSLNFRPQYTASERDFLYGDQRFVIDIHDVNKAPDNVFIWQINEKGRYLRQFYPAKFAGRQFHSSTPKMWYFLEEDFRSEAFCERFQPIYTVVASRKICCKETKYTEEMVEEVVQYVYIDKMFFARMAKNLGRIHTLNLEPTLRTAFIDSLPVYTMVCIVPAFISGVSANPDYEGYKKFRRYIDAWRFIDTYTFNMLQAAGENSEMKHNHTIDLITYLPHMSYSEKNVNKNVLCSACLKRTPVVTVHFSQTENSQRPYNPYTFEPLPPSHNVIPPTEPLHWCKSCATAAKRFHRFYHFRYFLHRLVKQNMARDVNVFRQSNAEVSDTLLIWIMMTEKSWQNTMFLDFLVCAAEMHSEFRLPSVIPPAINITSAVGEQFPAREMSSTMDVDTNNASDEHQTNGIIPAIDMSAIDELIALAD